MTTPQDREPELPRWDAPPQPPAWDRPAETGSAWGPPPGGPGAPSPYAYGGSPVPTGPPTTSTKAVVALVLALAAYTPLVPFIGAIAALFVSRSARREIDASGGALTGRGLCRAANVLSVLHLVFLALGVLVVVAVFLLPFSFS